MRKCETFLIRGGLNAWGGNNCSNGNIIYNFTDTDKVIFLNKGNYIHISGPTILVRALILLLHLHPLFYE